MQKKDDKTIKFHEPCPTCGQRLKDQRTWIDLARLYEEIANSSSVSVHDPDLVYGAAKRACFCYEMVLNQLWFTEELSDIEDEDPTEARVCFLTIKSEIEQILDTFGGSKSGFRTRQRHRVRYWALIGAIEGIRDHMNALLNSIDKVKNEIR
jgi:hypothetical protein